MPRVPLAFRRSAAAAHSSDEYILLVKITHADLAEPIRLSTDPTERLAVEPLSYGTISNGETYQFVEMSALLPDDRKNTPPRVALTFENLDSSYVELARSFTSPARADSFVVFAASPDTVYKSIRRLQVAKVSYNETQMTFDLSREHLSQYPAGRRMTKDRNPGLHGIPSA